MRTLLRIFGGTVLITGGFLIARTGCMLVVTGLHGGTVLSIVGAILGIALAAGCLPFCKGMAVA
jgi:hypothetical protein